VTHVDLLQRRVVDYEYLSFQAHHNCVLSRWTSGDEDQQIADGCDPRDAGEHVGRPRRGRSRQGKAFAYSKRAAGVATISAQNEPKSSSPRWHFFQRSPVLAFSLSICERVRTSLRLDDE